MVENVLNAHARLKSEVTKLNGVTCVDVPLADAVGIAVSAAVTLSLDVSVKADIQMVIFCIDTCHIFAAGYDISTAAGFENVMADFDQIIGIKYLRAMHLNDAKKECGSRVDRHECLGKGCIGMEGFKYIMQSPYFDNMPLVLETPEPELWADEIKLLRSVE